MDQATIIQNLNNMKNYYFLLFLLTAFHCSSKRVNDLRFNVYDKQSQKVIEMTREDVRYVDWDNQCYYIVDDKVAELKEMNLLGGKIDLSFQDEILASIQVSSVYSSQLQKGYFLPCTDNGQILIEDGAICLRKLKESKDGVLSNSELYNFIKDVGLLKE